MTVLGGISSAISATGVRSQVARFSADTAYNLHGTDLQHSYLVSFPIGTVLRSSRDHERFCRISSTFFESSSAEEGAP